MNVLEVIHSLETRGLERAKLSTFMLEEGDDPTDTFAHEGMSIHDPWKSDCGRFEVNDPYITYGREFVCWLLRPDYDGVFSHE